MSKKKHSPVNLLGKLSGVVFRHAFQNSFFLYFHQLFFE